jgi:asparagine synthase (glutamine-hydrolysing)
MCGIAGIISTTGVDRERLKKMTDALAHRGPDGEGCWVNIEGKTALGHRRLAIIDTSPAAAQPMHFAGGYTIVHNGEIYNYIELREQLKKKGYQFTSQSDTEVILAAYDCWKEDCLHQFDGMFAFAIWNEVEKRLFAARDRLGEKPFFYFFDEVQGVFLFASEIKALWVAGIEKHVDNAMLLNYIAPGYVQNPADKSQTFFKNIHSLPPASFLTTTLSSVKPVIKNYWVPEKDTTGHHPDTGATTDKFRELLQISVNRRLRSDVPLGTSLSGGIDSGAIAALLSQLGHNKYKTFSAVFPGFEKDESGKIALITDALKLANYQTRPDADGLVKDFEKLCYHQEQPFASASIYAQYKVFELAAQEGVTVLLDGQGADEILAGYSKYTHWYLQELWLSNKKAFADAANVLTKNGSAIGWGSKNKLAAYLPKMAANRLTAKAVKLQHTGDIHPDFLMQHQNRESLQKPVVRTLNDILYFDTVQMGLEELLRYADRNSMAHGREVRLPFLNHQLVEFVFSLPAQFKINEGYSKWILRKSIDKLLPAEVVWQTKKTGFEPPQQQWMHNALLQDYMQEAKRSLVKQGVLLRQVLQKKVLPKAAHEADNFDWRYLTAAGTLL